MKNKRKVLTIIISIIIIIILVSVSYIFFLSNTRETAVDEAQRDNGEEQNSEEYILDLQDTQENQDEQEINTEEKIDNSQSNISNENNVNNSKKNNTPGEVKDISKANSTQSTTSQKSVQTQQSPVQPTPTQPTPTQPTPPTTQPVPTQPVVEYKKNAAACNTLVSEFKRLTNNSSDFKVRVDIAAKQKSKNAFYPYKESEIKKQVVNLTFR